MRWRHFPVGGALALLLAAGGRAQTPGDATPRFDEPFVRGEQSEPGQDEAKWPAALRSDCSGRVEATGPVVCIRRSGGPSFRRGEPITAEISWRNADEMFLIVSLEHDAPPDAHYLGPRGPLPSVPPLPSSSGSLTFRWDGRTFACRPHGMSPTCEQGAEIGRYRLRVSLHDRRPGAFVVPVPHGRASPPLAYSLSTSFVVTGQPDFSPLAREMWWAAVHEARRTADVDHSIALAGDIHGTGVRVTERAGLLCARIPALAPFRGALESCIPKARLIGEAGLLRVPPEEMSVTGGITLIEGAISGSEAVTLAQAVADPLYRFRVRFHRQPQTREAGYDRARDGDFMAWSRRNPHATTYLSDSISAAVYRPDLGGAWLIVVDEIMAGGSAPDEERFADKVLVLVQPDRRACVLETTRYRGGQFSLDLRTARPRC